MSIRTTDSTHVALYDSVTGRAFGPTFESEEHAEDFVEWCCNNTAVGLTRLTDTALVELHTRWFAERLDYETGELRV